MNNLIQAVNRIYVMQDAADAKRGKRKSIFKHLGKLTEEVGEFAEAMLEDDGYKTNDKDKADILKEAKKEVADMFIMVIVLAHQLGMAQDEIVTTLEKKLDKWQSKHIDSIK